MHSDPSVLTRHRTTPWPTSMRPDGQPRKVDGVSKAYQDILPVFHAKLNYYEREDKEAEAEAMRHVANTITPDHLREFWGARAVKQYSGDWALLAPDRGTTNDSFIATKLYKGNIGSSGEGEMAKAVEEAVAQRVQEEMQRAEEAQDRSKPSRGNKVKKGGRASNTEFYNPPIKTFIDAVSNAKLLCMD